MARTQLMTFVQRALRLARQSAASGIPVDELAEQKREAAAARAFDRRSFLQLSAGALGAVALPMGDFLSEERSAPRVAIVGGGMAGLHCAWRLNRLGITADVYDAAKRLGGRMYSDRNTFPDGQHCELGGELIDTGHVTMHDLSQELDIELLDYNEDAPSLSRLVSYFDGRRRSDAEILRGFVPIADRIDRALQQLDDPEDYITYSSPNGAQRLDRLSLSAWMDLQGIPRQDLTRRLIELAYIGEYGLETDVTNSLNLLTFISTDTTRLELFGESDERFHTKTGNDTFTNKLADRLGSRRLNLEHRLVSLRSLSDGRYELTFSTLSGLKTVKAEHVVLALPFTLLRQVDIRVSLPAVKRKALNELGYGTNSKLMVGFNSRLWRRAPHLSDGSTYADVGYMQTWETSRLQPGNSGIITNFTGGKGGLAQGVGTPQQRAADFLDGFNKVFPGVKATHNGRVARMHWPTHPFTLGSYSAYKVGQFTTIAGAEIERVGNLHFCGEHTSLDAQGYMEGAALTGAMAAAEVADDLGCRVAEVAGPGARIMDRARSSRVNGRWVDGLRRQRRQRAG